MTFSRPKNTWSKGIPVPFPDAQELKGEGFFKQDGCPYHYFLPSHQRQRD